MACPFVTILGRPAEPALTATPVRPADLTSTFRGACRLTRPLGTEQAVRAGPAGAAASVRAALFGHARRLACLLTNPSGTERAGLARATDTTASVGTARLAGAGRNALRYTQSKRRTGHVLAFAHAAHCTTTIRAALLARAGRNTGCIATSRRIADLAIVASPATAAAPIRAAFLALTMGVAHGSARFAFTIGCIRTDPAGAAASVRAAQARLACRSAGYALSQRLRAGCLDRGIETGPIHHDRP